MPSVILWILLCCSSALYAQSPTTQDQMRALGYEAVDLKALRQTSTPTPCTNCPRARTATAPTPPPPAQELQSLRQQQTQLQSLLADPNTDPAMRPKYQVALDRTQARIRTLEQQLKTTSSTSVSR